MPDRTFHPGDDGLLARFGFQVLRGVCHDAFFNHVEEALADLRKVIGADAAEVFLAEPGGEDLVMTACSSGDLDAFLEKARFPKGIGFPGIVYHEGRSLRTEDLQGDRRYLRRAVVTAGYHSYYCVPLVAGERVLGTVNLAWSTQEPGWDRVEGLLPEVAEALATALIARQGVIELAGRSALEQGDGGEPLERFLALMLDRTGSSAGVLLLLGANGQVKRMVRRGSLPWSCVETGEGELFRCLALERGHASVRDPLDRGAASQCPAGEPIKKPRFCVPIRLRDRMIGALLLERADSDLPLATRSIPELFWASNAAAFLLGETLRTLLNLPKPVPEGAEQTTKRLTLSCLGPFRIRLAGNEVPFSYFRRRKAVELLRILAVHTVTPLAAVSVAERLWPGLREEQAQNRFNVTLHALRSALSDSRKDGFVLAEHGLYRLNRALVAVDIDELHRMAGEGRDLVEQGDLETAARRLAQAASLYSGDLFSDDLYTEWSFVFRVRLRNDYVAILEDLAACHEATGDARALAETLRRAVTWEPFREDLQQRFIRTLIRIGRTKQARDQCRECIRLVSKELGLDPLPETMELAERLKVAVAGGSF